MDHPHLWKKPKQDDGVAGLALFAEPALAPSVPVATSEAAAAEIAQHLAKRRKTVFVAFCQLCEANRTPATDNEVIAHLIAQGWSPSAASNGTRNRRGEVQKPLRGEPLLAEAGVRDGCMTYRPTAHGWATYLDLCHGESVACARTSR